MKRLSLKNPLLTFAAVTLLAHMPGAMAKCELKTSTIDLNYGANLTSGGLNIPADAPIGTVVYQESLQASRMTWQCDTSFMYGIIPNPALATIAVGASVSTFPIGKTGLSYRIWTGSQSYYLYSKSSVFPGNYVFPAGGMRLEIVKTGELSSLTKIAAGHLGSLKFDNSDLYIYNLINPIVLNAASCKTPSVSVAMGDDYQLHEFRDANPTPRTVRFNIALNQCQAGIQKVTYLLKANTTAIDAEKGIVALNAGSTAKGIGLQLMNDAGLPIALDTIYPFDAFTTTATDFNIPLSASYYRLTNDELKAGSANTEVTFIVNYL
ncbi:fimbrial protein [Pseudomonas sp. P155]|uniref:Fimbrial protein n=1 Tax=Pseudomonas neuropathica TaxID=2730425 RepID=A0ABS0BJS3_9PSED|nr:fimbrial protein [Pseudomonas neuropathica]MBF6033999.1 fimbrial protein [Pseudomonas neuropathica]